MTNIDKLVKEYTDWLLLKPQDIHHEIDDFGFIDFFPDKDEFIITKESSLLEEKDLEISISTDNLKSLYNILRKLFEDEETT